MNYCLFDGGSLFGQTTSELLATTNIMGISILVSVFIIVLVGHYLHQLTKGNPSFPWNRFWQGVLLLFFLLLYRPLMQGVGSFTCTLIGFFPAGPDVLTAINETIEENDSWFGVLGYLMDGSADIYLFEWVKSYFLTFARLMIEYLRQLIGASFLIVGPLALSLEFIPIFQGVARKWFLGMTGVLFWGLTLRILDLFVYEYSTNFIASAQYFQAGASIVDPDRFSYYVLNVVFGFLYLVIPLLTSFYISSGAGSQLFGRILGGFAGATMMLGKVIPSSQGTQPLPIPNHSSTPPNPPAINPPSSGVPLISSSNGSGSGGGRQPQGF